MLLLLFSGFLVTFALRFPLYLVLSTSCLADINLTVPDIVIAVMITLRWI